MQSKMAARVSTLIHSVMPQKKPPIVLFLTDYHVFMARKSFEIQCNKKSIIMISRSKRSFTKPNDNDVEFFPSL